MKIAVIGAGAIGALVAGYLKSKNKNVFLVGHKEAVEAIRNKGLKICGVRGEFDLKIDTDTRLNFCPDIAIFATKTQDLSCAIKENLEFIANSVIVITQNGVQAEDIAARILSGEKIISSIVMFGSTNLEAGTVVHNFEGSWIIGSAFIKNSELVSKVKVLLGDIFPVVATDDIKAMKYLKIFVNANNCIPGILGLSMQECFASPEISSISIGIWKEGHKIVSGSRINLASLPDFPLERLTKLISLPTTEAAKIFSGIMANLSKEPLYGSILQSIKRGKLSEVDYINGEFVALAKTNSLRAPLNSKLVEMVHQVEKTKRFFTKEELINNTKGLFS
ncbi:MAG: 2-dehydropantoate 2-reductase [Candidatus Omnitrophica bacterium]|nr:2-dehydropantoate 2-reductase [Candidatus Omnitrophota bacterium]